MKKCVFAMALGLILLVNLSAGGGSQSKSVAGNSKVRGKTIGFIIPGPGVYYNYGMAGVKWAVEASGNIYTERNSDNNTIREIQNVEDLISARVDVIIIMTTNVETGQKGAQLANAANIPYFLIDCSITDGPGKAQGQVEMDMYAIGSTMADYLGKTNVGSGGYVVLGGLAGQSGTTQQLEGFLRVIDRNPNYKLLSEIQYADWDRKRGEDIMRNYLVMHNKIDLVYAMNEEMAFGAATAIVDAGRQAEMVIVSANGSEVGKDMLKAGTLKATTGWSPSENGILTVIKVLEFLNGTPQEYRTEVPLKVFTLENISEYSDWDLPVQAARYESVLKELGYWN
jgi:ABC-type sugar transport system substrate-binding protein